MITFRRSAFRELGTSATTPDRNTDAHAGALHHAAGRSAFRTILLSGSLISNVRSAGHARPVLAVRSPGLDFKASGQNFRRRGPGSQFHARLAQHEIVERDFDEIVL